MKQISEYKFKNKELLSALFNLPNNKDYKREKIWEVSVEEDKERELFINIETRFYTYNVSMFIDDNNSLYISGNINSTAYDEVDELLINWYDEGTVGEFEIELSLDESSIEHIIDEMISQMNQDEWISRFKLLNKVYNSLKKFSDSAYENNIEGLFNEMVRNYVYAIE